MAKPAPIPSCRDSQATLSFTALHKELGYTFSLCMTISYLIERKRVKVNARIKIIYMKRALLSLRSVHALSSTTKPTIRSCSFFSSYRDIKITHG